MDQTQTLAEILLRQVFLEVEASGRHVHLTEDAALQLFGHGLTVLRPLSQPGQFVCRERVSLRGPKGELHKVAVLGPCRRENQVELSLTDCVSLGISAPVRLSGSVENSPGITLFCGERELIIEQGVIVAQRHIHMSPDDAKKFDVKDGDYIDVDAFSGTRKTRWFDVQIRVNENFRLEMHVDTDDANAVGFKNGSTVTVAK